MMSDSFDSTCASAAAAAPDDDSAECSWFDAGNSRRRRATIHRRGKHVWAVADNGERRDGVLGESIKITSRLGNTPRALTFADGVMLSLADNNFIDTALSGRRFSFLHYLESHWPAAAMCAAAAVAVVAAVVLYGLPSAADYVARRIPQETARQLGEAAHRQLQKEDFFQPSQLTPPQIMRLQELFERVVDGQPNGESFRLHSVRFNIGDRSVANAFALPGGIVVVADRAAEILTDEQMLAVLAHEIGHIQARHGLRAVVGSAGMFAFLTIAFGDVSLLLSGGAVLLNLKYSRDYEREADCFAYHYLRRRNLSPSLIGESLRAMENDFESAYASSEKEGDDNSAADSDSVAEDFETADFKSDDEILDSDNLESVEDAADSERRHIFWRNLLTAISTHPETEERKNLAAACPDNS